MIAAMGAATEPSTFTATACGVPRLKPYSAGENGFTCAITGCELSPLRVTIKFACPGIVSQGAWALIWPAETNFNGAGTPLMVTESTSPSVVERVAEPAWERLEAR